MNNYCINIVNFDFVFILNFILIFLSINSIKNFIDKMIEAETTFSERQSLSIVQLISNNKGKDITKQIKEAIKQGQDINQSEEEMTPLWLSIKLEDFKLTKFLIKNDADMMIKAI